MTPEEMQSHAIAGVWRNDSMQIMFSETEAGKRVFLMLSKIEDVDRVMMLIALSAISDLMEEVVAEHLEIRPNRDYHVMELDPAIGKLPERTFVAVGTSWEQDTFLKSADSPESRKISDEVVAAIQENPSSSLVIANLPDDLSGLEGDWG